MTEQNTTAAPGFYPDGSGQMRYWDGQQWTAATPPAAAPVKKKHTVRNVLLILLALVALTFVGCAALVGSAVNEVDNAIQAEEAKDDAPGGPNNPLEITEGEGFSVLGFDYSAGWSVDTDEIGDATISGLKVTNNREDQDSALVEIKFMQGSEVLALVDCTTEPVNVGQTTTLDCMSTDEVPSDYDAITINDTF